jgi:hypothetical protein
MEATINAAGKIAARHEHEREREMLLAKNLFGPVDRFRTLELLSLRLCTPRSRWRGGDRSSGITSSSSMRSQLKKLERSSENRKSTPVVLFSLG